MKLRLSVRLRSITRDDVGGDERYLLVNGVEASSSEVSGPDHTQTPVLSAVAETTFDTGARIEAYDDERPDSADLVGRVDAGTLHVEVAQGGGE